MALIKTLGYVNRRRFLCATAGAAAVAGSSLTLRRLGAASPDDLVIVVGAGLAGLRAAELIRRSGRRVLVLEARSVPGGRVRTVRSPFDDELYGELGPIRIADIHATVLQLAKEHGLTVIPFASSNGSAIAKIGEARLRIPEDLERAVWPLIMKPDERGLTQSALLERYVGELPRELADPAAETYAAWQGYDRVTWPALLRSRGASPGAVALMTLGGDSQALSGLYVLRQYALLRAVNQFYKIEGGMGLLPRAMAATLADVIQYDAPVVRIERSPRTTKVTYREGGRLKVVAARNLVLAVPFSTIRQIEIDPPFSSEKQQLISHLPYFAVTRFLLQFRRRFWHRSGLSGAARTDRPAEIWDATYDMEGDAGILGATLGAAASNALAHATPEECVRFGLDLVEESFPDIRADFDKGVAHRWALDPWARGAFAVFYPGQMASMMPLIARAEGRVSFAGEHTSAWMGWMEGALESGERAAHEVLDTVA